MLCGVGDAQWVGEEGREVEVANMRKSGHVRECVM